ncbi:hypothetical protein BG011_007978 [Mortierella polycephala]|uniref:ERCC4 domain-containing protein n=1 Tax=Mortierella polycephala TaxID=41804 RepID=A0A9P6TY25_9FUNG|nr:hypothetical protein BG011_007978 [Mortierella polycephala]
MTKCSQRTINRIFDGQFLKSLEPAATMDDPGDIVVMLSSSDDDTDNDVNDLGYITGGYTRNEAGTKRAPVGFPQANSVRGINNNDPLLSIRPQEHFLPSSSSNPSRRVCEEEPKSTTTTTIALPSTPKQHSTDSSTAFLPSISQETLSDWDYELIPSPVRGAGKPTIILSSPSSKSTGNWTFPESRTVDRAPYFPPVDSEEHYSPINSPTNNKSSFLRTKASLRTPSPPVYSGRSSPPRFARAVSPQVFVRSNAHIKPNSSRKGSPIASDLLPRESPISDLVYGSLDGITEPSKETVKEPWESLIDASLSPPRMFEEDWDDSEQEQLMDDVFSGLAKGKGTKKKGFSRTNSAKSLTEGSTGRNQCKRKQPSWTTAVDLEDWDDDRDLDGPMSLEQEIVARASRRKAKVRNTNAGSEDDESAESAASSDAKRKRVEKELQKEAKEAEKVAKEAERAAKKLAREQEQQRKRDLKEQERLSKEEERQAEKKAARELRIANRLTTKAEGAKDMILCIEETLYRSSFGLALQDYLAPIECQVELLKPPGARETHGAHETSPARNVLYWRRTVNHRYDEEQDLFVPLGEKEVELESFALIYQTADEFADMIEQDQLKSFLSAVKREMRLRKNKEMMAMSSTSVNGPMRLKDDRRKRQRTLFLISGMESYLRGLRKATTKKFQQAVLASLGQGRTDAASSITVAQLEEAVVDQGRIDKELLWLQLEQDCLVIHSNDDDETAQFIVSLTEQIGLLPYKDVRKTGLNVCIEGIKSGTDASDTWVRSLQEIHMVTPNVARSIASEYPTIRSLYEGYRACASAYEAQTMLEGIPIVNRNTFLGKMISRRVYDVFMSEDPEQSVS